MRRPHASIEKSPTTALVPSVVREVFRQLGDGTGRREDGVVAGDAGLDLHRRRPPCRLPRDHRRRHAVVAEHVAIGVDDGVVVGERVDADDRRHARPVQQAARVVEVAHLAAIRREQRPVDLLRHGAGQHRLDQVVGERAVFEQVRSTCARWHRTAAP